MSADKIADSMRRLSSGLRINTAADDAAGLGISEKMRAQVRGLEVAGRNIQDGISMLQVMDGALQEVHSILHRARELAVQWNGAVAGFDGRVAILKEWAQLSNEIARIEETTEFNGIKVLKDDQAVVTLQVGANDGEIITISLVELFGPTVGDLVRPNTFTTLPWLDAQTTGFDLHINDVSQARARIGATQNRLEHAYRATQVYQENLMQAESRVRDVDMAQEMTKLTKQQVIQQAATTIQLFADRSPKRLLDLLPS